MNLGGCWQIAGRSGYGLLVDQAADAYPGWAASQASDIGHRVAQRRAELKLSAQQLADRCTALGMPSFTRQVIMRLEHERRDNVSVSELSVLAAALEISPVLLLYPLGRDEQTEYLPGHKASTFEAARWWSGEVAVDPRGDMYPGERRAPVLLFRDHYEVLTEVPADYTEAAYQRARRGRPGAPAGQREPMFAVLALREIRASIRDAGLKPPQLPKTLAWIDSSSG
jgi:transcriptional regulator with XRE-family HTH domain